MNVPCLHFCGDVLIVYPITYFFLCSQLHVSSIQYRRAKHTRCILYTLYFLAQIHTLHSQMSYIYPLLPFLSKEFYEVKENFDAVVLSMQVP
jgi:hypothetical protein